MVSPNKASFDLRESFPLSRNILHSWEMNALADTGQRTNLKVHTRPTGYQGWLVHRTSQNVSAGYLKYPADVRDTAKSGIGHFGNRHLRYLVESISVNVGGSQQDVKASSLPMPVESVGGSIVVRGWESQPHGKGSQLVGIPEQNNQMLTRRNL